MTPLKSVAERRPESGRTDVLLLIEERINTGTEPTGVQLSLDNFFYQQQARITVFFLEALDNEQHIRECRLRPDGDDDLPYQVIVESPCIRRIITISRRSSGVATSQRTAISGSRCPAATTSSIRTPFRCGDSSSFSSTSTEAISDWNSLYRCIPPDTVSVCGISSA
jgi:hypothetical protein